jgi:hypothetical protein
MEPLQPLTPPSIVVAGMYKMVSAIPQVDKITLIRYISMISHSPIIPSIPTQVAGVLCKMLRHWATILADFALFWRVPPFASPRSGDTYQTNICKSHNLKNKVQK